MKNNQRILLGTLLLLGLPACLENEEKIEVRADGSVRVELVARGQVFDLAGGYPLPLDPSWRAMGAETDFWLTNIGPDTGHGARPNVRTHFPAAPGKDQPGSELRVEREFASVADWPRWFAPASEPYRTAFMERSATLEINAQTARTVYVFERTYHGCDYARLDLESRAQEELGEDFWPRLEQPNALDDTELARVRDVLADIYMDVAELFVRDALLGIYTSDDASLPAYEIPGVVGAVRAAVGGLMDVGKLRRINQLIAAKDSQALEQLAGEFEAQYREILRASLATALAGRGVDDGTVNAMLYSLEWGFTAFDHYGDLSDEDFAVEVSMPGVLVGGNFHDSDGNTAAWKFTGAELRSGDYQLRVLSVLEAGKQKLRRR